MADCFKGKLKRSGEDDRQTPGLGENQATPEDYEAETSQEKYYSTR
jgi:hypothetical protein